MACADDGYVAGNGSTLPRDNGRGVELRVSSAGLDFSNAQWTLHIRGNQGSVNLDMRRLSRELKAPTFGGMGQFAATTATAFVAKKYIAPVATAFTAERTIMNGDFSSLTSRGVIDGAAWGINKVSRGNISSSMAKDLVLGYAAAGMVFDSSTRHNALSTLPPLVTKECEPRQRSVMFECSHTARPATTISLDKLGL